MSDLERVAISAEAEKPEILQDYFGHNETPAVALPENWTLESLENFLEDPMRLHRDFRAQTADSVIAYAREFTTASRTSRIYANRIGEEIKVILDDHPNGLQPSWCKHHVHFKLRPSREWTSWMDNNNMPSTLTKFAEFLEDRAKEIQDPNGSDLVSLITNFKDERNNTYKSSTIAATGEAELIYTSTRGPGATQLPDKITIAVRPYEGYDLFKLQARIKFQIKEEKVIIRYELIEPERAREQAFDELSAHIASELGLPVFTGSV